MMYIVNKQIVLGYDSHVHRPTSPRHKVIEPGAVLTLDSEAPNGNVWFIDEDGERGKIECGSVSNLLRDGRVGLHSPVNRPRGPRP